MQKAEFTAIKNVAAIGDRGYKIANQYALPR
jgi:hypothetical protein